MLIFPILNTADFSTCSFSSESELILFTIFICLLKQFRAVCLCALHVCLFVWLCLCLQMHQLGLPSFMSNTLEDLNIGTYNDIATVRCYCNK